MSFLTTPLIREFYLLFLSPLKKLPLVLILITPLKSLLLRICFYVYAIPLFYLNSPLKTI